MLSAVTAITRPEKPESWLGLTVPSGCRLKNRIELFWHVA